MWEGVAKLPTELVKTAAVGLLGHVHVVGGVAGRLHAHADGRTATAAHLRYDPDAGAWVPMPPMPTARQGLAAVALRDQLYVLGGLSGDGAMLATVERFCPAAGAWAILPDMPTARRDFAAVVLGNFIYALGGGVFDGEEYQPVATVERYDYAAGTWVQVAEMQLPRMCFAAAALDGQIYAVGGVVDTDDMLDPEVTGTVERSLGAAWTL